MLVGVLRVDKTVTEKWKQSLERGGRSIGEQLKILESVDGDNLRVPMSRGGRKVVHM